MKEYLKMLLFFVFCLSLIALGAYAQKPVLVQETAHEDLVFFEGKLNCDTTATPFLSRAVVSVTLINNSAGSIFISDDSSVAITDTEIVPGGSLNNIKIQNMSQMQCIAVTAAKDMHFVGLESG